MYHKCLESLVNDHGFTKKRAKESARFFRGYNTQIDVDIMFNWRSFVHFLTLRASEHSQKEICAIANTMLYLVSKIEGNPFVHTIAAFNLKYDENKLLI